MPENRSVTRAPARIRRRGCPAGRVAAAAPENVAGLKGSDQSRRRAARLVALAHQEKLIYLGMATSAQSRTQTAELFHALSDPTRLRLLEILRGGERCVCDLTDALEAGQSRLSFHLKALREAGLVSQRREGRWMYYALRPEALEAAAAALEAVRPLRTAGRAAV